MSKPSQPIASATPAVFSLGIVCAMIVALAMAGEGAIIGNILITIGNLAVNILTLYKAEQIKKTTEDTQSTAEKIKQQTNGVA